jgi:hypothetical protein
MFGLGRGLPVRVVDSDVSTVTAEADKVLLVGGPQPGIVHVEVQSSYDKSLPLRLFRYDALLSVRHDLPVLSAAVLLAPEVDGPAIDGLFAQEWPDGRCRVELRYPVVRVWELPVDDLAAGPGTFPLIALAARSEDELERVAAPVLAALHDPPTQDERELHSALYFLVGRRFSKDVAARILRGDPTMRESVTYMAVLEEGRIDEARRMILRLGTTRFGPPDDASRARLDALAELEKLEALGDRVLTAVSWEDILAGTP